MWVLVALASGLLTMCAAGNALGVASAAGTEPIAVDPDQVVQDVGYRLASHAGDLCPDQAPLIGLEIQDLSQFRGHDRDAAKARYGLGTTPQIATVADGSAAARAGLRPGDDVVGINGAPPPLQPAGAATFARVAATLDAIDDAARRGPLTMTVRRGDVTLAITIVPDHGCRSRFLIDPRRTVNSEADGSYVKIDMGMIRFAGSDEQIAVIAAHELAHNILGHRARLDALRASLGNGRDSRRLSAAIRATEEQADRLGVYLLDRAGFSPRAAVAFWSRYAETRGKRARDDTHAAPAERVAVIRREVARLEAMKALGQPPHPDFWPPVQGEEAHERR